MGKQLAMTQGGFLKCFFARFINNTESQQFYMKLCIEYFLQIDFKFKF